LAHQSELEALPARKLAKRLPEVLADAPRPGHPPTFAAAQVAQLIALACESPKAAGLPISHWTITALTEEAVRRGIVESISRRSVWRFLKSGRVEAAPGPTVAQSA
jgi:putative transposase